MSYVKIIDIDQLFDHLNLKKLNFYLLFIIYDTFDIKLVIVMRENSKDQR